MSKVNEKSCLVIGGGKMGQAYIKSLVNMSFCEVSVWVPSNNNVEALKKLACKVYVGDLDLTLRKIKPSYVIVASPVNTLFQNAKYLLLKGVKNILLEKPGALSSSACQELIQLAKSFDAKIYIGYNRRFYSSIEFALKEIEKLDEKIESVIFEFNEPFPNGKPPSGQPKEALNRWIISNSLHVIDTAFFKVGFPSLDQLSFKVEGGLDWHQAGRCFVGHGKVGQNTLFSFHANWGRPGRWSVQWITVSRRFIFCPLEELRIVKFGDFNEQRVSLENELDTKFKAGLVRQCEAFLFGFDNEKLATLGDALKLLKIAEKLGSYPPKL